MVVNWVSDWPTEPGYYWLAGYVWSDKEPKLYFVEVRPISNGLMATTKGNFLFKSDVKGDRKWSKATLPALPDIAPLS